VKSAKRRTRRAALRKIHREISLLIFVPLMQHSSENGAKGLWVGGFFVA
jgi:hypothetical protein